MNGDESEKILLFIFKKVDEPLFKMDPADLHIVVKLSLPQCRWLSLICQYGFADAFD